MTRTSGTSALILAVSAFLSTGAQAQVVSRQNVSLSSPGTYTIAIPPDATSIRIGCWGAGGGGGRSIPASGGGGGGGGAFQAARIANGTSSVSATIGQGGASGAGGTESRAQAGSQVYCRAGGGGGGSSAFGGDPGMPDASASALLGFAGGAGGDGETGSQSSQLTGALPHAGGGGASAHPNGAGGVGQPGQSGGPAGGGAAGEQGGAGGSGGQATIPGANGVVPGGGGGGGGTPGSGANGRIVVTYMSASIAPGAPPALSGTPEQLPPTPPPPQGDMTPSAPPTGGEAGNNGSVPPRGASELIYGRAQWNAVWQRFAEGAPTPAGTRLLSRVVCPAAQTIIGVAQQDGPGIEISCSAVERVLWTANPNVTGLYFDRAVGPVTQVRNDLWVEGGPAVSGHCPNREHVTGQIIYFDNSRGRMVDDRLHVNCDTMADVTPDEPYGSGGIGEAWNDGPIRASWWSPVNIVSDVRCPWPDPGPIGVEVRTPNHVGRRFFLICSFDPLRPRGERVSASIDDIRPVGFCTRQPDACTRPPCRIAISAGMGRVPGGYIDRTGACVAIDGTQPVVPPQGSDRPVDPPSPTPGPCTANPNRCTVVPPTAPPVSPPATPPPPACTNPRYCRRPPSSVSPNDNPPTPVPGPNPMAPRR